MRAVRREQGLEEEEESRELSTVEDAVAVVVVDEEAFFVCESITNEDPPDAHQAKHRPKPRIGECVASVHP